MARILALVILLYAAEVQSGDNDVFLICSCGSPAIYIIQAEDKCMLVGVNKEERAYPYLEWACSQSLKQINKLHILKTEHFTTHKCPIRI